MQNEQKHTSDTLIIYKQNFITNDNKKKTILKEGRWKGHVSTITNVLGNSIFPWITHLFPTLNNLTFPNNLIFMIPMTLPSLLLGYLFNTSLICWFFHNYRSTFLALALIILISVLPKFSKKKISSSKNLKIQ